MLSVTCKREHAFLFASNGCETETRVMFAR